MSQEYDFSSFDSFDFGVEESAAEQAPANDSTGVDAAVAVVDADPAVGDYLASLIPGPVDVVGELQEVENRFGLDAQLVILGPSCTEEFHLATVERWGRTYSNVAAILITAELTTQLLHKALRAGVKDVLSAPIDADMLVETVSRVAEGLPSAQQLLAPSDTGAPSPLDDGEQGQVITVFSTKGGSGKSVAATNLGTVLARRSQKPVVLIDGHLQFGDVAVMLKLQPQHTVVDAVGQIDNLDAALMERFLAKHEPSGLFVLPAPMEPSFADQVTGEQMVRLIEVVRRFAGHVVVDLPSIFNDFVLSVLEAADDIVLVAGLDIPNIKNVKIGLSTLQMLNVPTERLHLVLNRADSKVKLNVSEVERTLGVPAAAHVPSDVVVPISVNKGSPVVLSAPKSGVARAYDELALRFLDGATADAGSGSGIRKFFG
jgi:pilus assembly protein CpaE